MATIIVDNNCVQAKQRAKYAGSLLFTERRGEQPQSEWDKAIAEGAVTVDEFIDELQYQLRQHYANA